MDTSRWVFDSTAGSLSCDSSSLNRFNFSSSLRISATGAPGCSDDMTFPDESKTGPKAENWDLKWRGEGAAQLKLGQGAGEKACYSGHGGNHTLRGWSS